jgi:hypothetical protein
MTRHGCCVDYGKNGGVCQDEHADKCMILPEGKTCSDCAHLYRCESFGYTDSAQNNFCSFHPRRFQEKK